MRKRSLIFALCCAGVCLAGGLGLTACADMYGGFEGGIHTLRAHDR